MVNIYRITYYLLKLEHLLICRKRVCPLVFLNACQVGRQAYNLTGTGGFAGAFVNSGAGAFISTHWSVGDSSAFNFSETLYNQLLAGKNIMTAVAVARKAAKNKQDMTWLAYVVYADPYARLIKE